jgi:hypothetical protein
MVWLAGELISQGYPYTARALKKAAGTGKDITRGQLLSYDKSGKVWQVASAGDIKPFAVALKSATEDDTEILDCLMNAPFECTVKAGGVIDPYTYVQAGNDGVVIAWAGDPNTPTLNSDDYRVGLYIGTEGHMDGQTPAIAAALNDIICIRRVE